MTSGGDLQRTALYDEHVAAGANLVDFHGFELPIWYTSIKDEHLACRSAAGLFDVSHMGAFRFVGDGVATWLESVVSQQATAIAPGRCAYTHICDDEGRVIDDMIFAVVSDIEILGVPNASMIDVMWAHYTALLPTDGSIELQDLSPETSILALQGPVWKPILAAVMGEEHCPGRFRVQLLPEGGWIQGTGYTGESGVEIFVPNAQAPQLWRDLLQAGEAHGLVPVGLGARDTLRLEKGFLLSGTDFRAPQVGAEDGEDEAHVARLAITSWQTNTPFGVHLEHDFVGAEVLRAQAAADDVARLWGVKMVGRGPPLRGGMPVFGSAEGDDEVGFLTSGAPAPSLGNVGVGFALVAAVAPGDALWVQVNPRKRVECEVQRPPFV